MQRQCQRLAHLSSVADSDAEREICEHCPLAVCIYDHPLKQRPAPVITERFAQCTHCLATETIYFQGNTLLTSYHWHKVGNTIVHTCGEAKLFPPTNTRL